MGRRVRRRRDGCGPRPDLDALQLLGRPSPGAPADARRRQPRGARPVAGAEVRCDAYRACTDDDGVASLELPAGAYDLTARADGFEGRPRRVDVATDLAI